MKKRLVEDGGRLLLFIGRQMKYFDMHTPAASILTHGYLPEIDPESAAFIVGLYLKMSVRDLLLAAHREKALPDLPEYKWGSRNKLYQAVDKITLADYAAKYLLPTYPQKTLDELFYESDLRSLEKNLKNSPAVRVIHSYDDFLLTPQDRVWLDETFGDKLLWLSRGAHLGGLYYKAAAEEMLRAGGVAE